MDDDKWIAVDKRSNKLIIRFRVSGYRKQFFVATRLKDTKRNREIVRSRRDAIATDISLGRFDATLESYQFRASAIAPAALAPAALVREKPQAKYQYNLQQLWERYTDFQSCQLEKTTILTEYRAIANLINQLPTRSLEDASKIREWVLGNRSHYVSWNLLNCLNRCCTWASESDLIPENPFQKLKIQKPKKSSDDDDHRAFTLEQRDLIIEAFEQDSLHSHYSSLVKFLFWSGCRPGEAFALTWGDISDDCCRITISKSCNGHRVKKGTKNGKKRVFPCQVGSRLQQMLLSDRPRSYNSSDLIFLSKAGRPINSGIMFAFWSEWRSENVYKRKVYKYAGVVKKLSEEGKVIYLKPYATRHTFATWAISSGITPDKVALWIGDTVETVLKYYCHPEIVNAECPDF
ncbi:integrase family protein [Calothrix sp. PCC 7507]|nr:integrase family protein [Calothrix sp. PCC 7507]